PAELNGRIEQAGESLMMAAVATDHVWQRAFLLPGRRPNAAYEILVVNPGAATADATIELRFVPEEVPFSEKDVRAIQRNLRELEAYQIRLGEEPQRRLAAALGEMLQAHRIARLDSARSLVLTRSEQTLVEDLSFVQSAVICQLVGRWASAPRGD